MTLSILLFLICSVVLPSVSYAEDPITRAPVKLNNHDETPHVSIKVFRGPNEEKDGEHFVSWGYWFKQPSRP